MSTLVMKFRDFCNKVVYNFRIDLIIFLGAVLYILIITTYVKAENKGIDPEAWTTSFVRTPETNPPAPMCLLDKVTSYDVENNNKAMFYFAFKFLMHPQHGEMIVVQLTSSTWKARKDGKPEKMTIVFNLDNDDNLYKIDATRDGKDIFIPSAKEALDTAKQMLGSFLNSSLFNIEIVREGNNTEMYPMDLDMSEEVRSKFIKCLMMVGYTNPSN